LEWLPDAQFIRNPIAEIEPKRLPEYPLKILHMYHNPITKGSQTIDRVLKFLKDEKLDFEYKILVKRPHCEAIDAISKCHLVIDQFLDRSKTGIPSIIGMVSLESMAMGRGVISTMDREYRRYYPECPVIQVEPNEKELADRIRECARDQSIIRRLANSGVEYIQKNHSPLETAKQLDLIYHGLGIGHN
jgi:hypothetical protein